jgi:glycosyltransferase involved in cell wall biosynthesis
MKERVFFYVLIRSRNCSLYIDRCINSLLSQTYKYYKILFVDDASKYTSRFKQRISNKLRNHVVVFNKKRKYSLRNAFEMIQKHAKDENATVFNLDGDDWLPNKDCLSKIAKTYQNNPKVKMTYGNCLIWDGKEVSKFPANKIIKGINMPYSSEVWKQKSFRKEPFLPLHPRTWKVSLFKSIPKKEFLNSHKRWLKFAEDMAIFFPMFEKVKACECKVLKKPIYVYNQANSHADIVENTTSLLKDELEIRKKHTSSSLPKGKNNQKITIYYHKLMSVPLVCDALYKIQLSLLKNNLTNSLFVSTKKNKYKNPLIKYLPQDNILIVETPRISNFLGNIKNPKIVNLPNLELKNMSINALYDLVWTLVFSDAVTPETRRNIDKILPSNYPTLKD